MDDRAKRLPPRAEALRVAKRAVRDLADGYEDEESVSFEDLLTMGGDELRHRQEVNAELRALADEMEREAVVLARAAIRKSQSND